jgi:hypothetical protein
MKSEKLPKRSWVLQLLILLPKCLLSICNVSEMSYRPLPEVSDSIFTPELSLKSYKSNCELISTF